MNQSELVAVAVAHYINFRMKDYDLPPAEIQRLNQLVDGMNVMASNMEALDKTVSTGFQSLLNVLYGPSDWGDRS